MPKHLANTLARDATSRNDDVITPGGKTPYKDRPVCGRGRPQIFPIPLGTRSRISRFRLHLSAESLSSQNALQQVETTAKPGESHTTNDTEPTVVMSQEVQAILARNEALRLRYVARSEELVQRAVDGWIDEEDFQKGENMENKLNNLDEDETKVVCVADGTQVDPSTGGDGSTYLEFQDKWLMVLAVVVQGR